MNELQKILLTPINSVLEYYGLVLASDKDRVNIICPFHSDTQPSLLVNQDKNFAYCFGCGKNWDAIQFIRQKENAGFFEAAKRLSEIAKMPLDISTLKYLYYNRNSESKDKEERVTQRDYEEMIVNIQVEFIRFYRTLPNWRIFHHYFDACLEELDSIVSVEEIGKHELDAVKDWLYKSKQFVESLRPEFESYTRFLREARGEWIGMDILEEGGIRHGFSLVTD